MLGRLSVSGAVFDDVGVSFFVAAAACGEILGGSRSASGSALDGPARILYTVGNFYWLIRFLPADTFAPGSPGNYWYTHRFYIQIYVYIYM